MGWYIHSKVPLALLSIFFPFVFFSSFQSVSSSFLLIWKDLRSDQSLRKDVEENTKVGKHKAYNSLALHTIGTFYRVFDLSFLPSWVLRVLERESTIPVIRSLKCILSLVQWYSQGSLTDLWRQVVRKPYISGRKTWSTQGRRTVQASEQALVSPHGPKVGFRRSFPVFLVFFVGRI